MNMAYAQATPVLTLKRNYERILAIYLQVYKKLVLVQSLVAWISMLAILVLYRKDSNDLCSKTFGKFFRVLFAKPGAKLSKS